MNRYTDEEIISYLKSLREGDVLTAIKDSLLFSKGVKYEIQADNAGDLFITNDTGYGSYVNVREDYKRMLSIVIEKGAFSIPKEDTGVGEIGISATEPDGDYFHVKVWCDSEGFSSLHDLVTESRKEVGLNRLNERRESLMREVAEVEEEIERWENDL